jgi:hypothetical protein
MSEPNFHRNNAAEWIMVAALYPVRLVGTIYAWLRRRLK